MGKKIRTIAEYALCILIPVVIFLIFRMTTISGVSMENTYKDGDRVFTMSIKKPKKGDVVVVDGKIDGEKIVLIKRLIAVEGDEVIVDYDRGKVYVNGEELDEPYLKDGVIKSEGEKSREYPYIVPKGCIFVMGDNRGNSVDSRDKRTEDMKAEDIKGVVIGKRRRYI